MRSIGSSVFTLPTRIRALFVYSRAPLSLIVWLLILILAVSIPGNLLQGRALTAQADNGIRIDLPANGQLRVENQFGDIEVTVWKERDVLVAAAIDSTVKPARSPVVIE